MKSGSDRKPFMIDPPMGWKYGFPALYNESKDGSMEEFLLSKGYPLKDLEFALSYMRCWEVDDKEQT